MPTYGLCDECGEVGPLVEVWPPAGVAVCADCAEVGALRALVALVWPDLTAGALA